MTTVVVPDQPGLPVYEQGRSGAYASGFFTAVLGTLPIHVDHAWVWDAGGRCPAGCAGVGGGVRPLHHRCDGGVAGPAGRADVRPCRRRSDRWLNRSLSG